MPGANEQFADLLTAHAVDVSRFEAGVRRDVLGNLHALQEELVAKIRRMDIEGVSREASKRARAEKLLNQTRETIRNGFRDASVTLKGHLRDLAGVEAEAIQTIAGTVFQADLLSVALTPGDLRALANGVLLEGNPASAWWGRQTEGLRMSFAREIRAGVAAGESTGDLVRRVRGRQVGRQTLVVGGRKRVVSKFAGGIMDVQTRQAEALVRTAVQSVSNEVLVETYKANHDVIDGVVAIATLDDRTTVLCMSRDGGAWDLNTGDPLPESATTEPWPGPSPWHFKCRTVIGPKTKSWDQLIEEAGGTARGKLKSVPPPARASMDGQVPGRRTYTEWLRSKPAAFQRDVLGRGRYELWKDGKLKHLSQLTDQTGRPLSIEQLRDRLLKRAG